MKELFFSSSTITIKVIVSEEDYTKLLKEEFLYSYIPSLKITDKKKDNYSAEIIIKKSINNNLILKYPKVEYYYKKFNPKDIISIIEYILERARQEEGIVCIHGAGAIYKNKVIVSWGSSTGIGKTTLAINIAEKSGKFYSDEKVLIDLKTSKAVGRIDKLYLSNNYWKDKYKSKKKYKKIDTTNKISYDICAFIYPIICDSKDYIKESWTSDKFLWHLYEETSRKIRGTSRIIFNNYPVESLDTLELSQKRLSLLKKFVKRNKCIYYKGNIDTIKNNIDDFLYK